MYTLPLGALTVPVAIDERPLVSVTVSETVSTPALLYVCVGLTPVPVLLSPKFHAYVSVSFCGSLDAFPFSVTALPSAALYGPPAFATGACAVMVAIVVALEVAPAASVTVSETVYAPLAAYTCAGEAPVAVLLSPKFHVYASVAPCGPVDPLPLRVTATSATRCTAHPVLPPSAAPRNPKSRNPKSRTGPTRNR